MVDFLKKMIRALFNYSLKSHIKIYLLALLVVSIDGYPEDLVKKTLVKWTAIFSNITPINSKTSQTYCDLHSPTVVVSTTDQVIHKKEMESLNGIKIKSIDYQTSEKNNLVFNVVTLLLNGTEENGTKWTSKMKLYEQALTFIGTTHGVWSTDKCKGTFFGMPTIVKK